MGSDVQQSCTVCVVESLSLLYTGRMTGPDVFLSM